MKKVLSDNENKEYHQVAEKKKVKLLKERHCQTTDINDILHITELSRTVKLLKQKWLIDEIISNVNLL